MQVPRSVVPAVLLVVAMVGVPLAGVEVANAVRPVIAAEPAIAPDPAGDVPEVPVPPATSRPLSTWFERLPVVELGPDAAPRPFVERYRAVSVGDAAASAKLIDAAFAELAVAKSDRAVTRSFLDALILPTDEDEDPDADPDAPALDPFETDAFKSLSTRAMMAIAATPANAVAINDLSVAIVTAAFANSEFASFGPDAGPPIASSGQLREAAIRLLELGRSSFPDDRAMPINLAYIQSLAGDAAEDETTDATTPPDPAIAALPGLQDYVTGAPTDVTARSLLANLVVRSDPEHRLDRAFAIAEPLIDDPDTEAAGRIIRGDSMLFVADRTRSVSPFQARTTVRNALDEYDRAIELTGDAAAYVGRARSLDMLGSRPDAAEAQREAVRLAPTSLAWRLRLAQLDGCAGQVSEWRRDAQDAFAMATTAKPTTMSATRYDLDDFPDRTYGRYSIGSDLPTWDVTLDLAATGSTIAALDPFPAPDACATSEPTALSGLDDAATEAVLATIANDDLAAARATLVTRRAQLPDSYDEDLTDPTTADAASTVLEALAGTPLPEDDPSVGIFVPLASRLPPDAQGRICRTLAGIGGLDAVDADLLTVCAAEAIARTGDPAGAEKAIEPAVRLSDTAHPMPGTTALQAGILSELSGHLDVARTRYEAASTYEDTSIAGLLRLGDLDLREGDATGALDHYALAEAAIRTQEAVADGTAMDDALAGRIEQYIDNNRGIALLMTARSATDTPPDCLVFPVACQQAGDAFASAMAADPLNPVYPMNAAWVARLTGDGARATALLTEALEKGTPLVAVAHNDLGVLAAGRGDAVDARAHFVTAIATKPDYDLATWNLGVLDSRQAGPLLVAGQASLADATRLDHDLLTDPVALQADERVYRIEVSGSGTQLELARAPGTGAAVGAAAFGAIAAVGAIGQLLSGIGGDVQDAAESVASEGAGKAGRRLRGLGRRFGSGGTDDGRRWPSWVAWIPAIIVLTVTTAWTAAWMAPDAFLTAVLIGLVAAGLSILVHACGHLVVAGRFGATLRPSGWTPGLALALVGMPFHVPAGPFLAERIETGDPGRDWWVSIAGVVANLAAAGVALLIYLAEPMPFLRILIATQLAVAAFSLIPSDPLDGERLATRPIVLALLGLGVAAASAALAVGAI